jgi:hypothetical protein
MAAFYRFGAGPSRVEGDAILRARTRFGRERAAAWHRISLSVRVAGGTPATLE